MAERQPEVEWFLPRPEPEVEPDEPWAREERELARSEVEPEWPWKGRELWR